jgi:hypothetical protein
VELITLPATVPIVSRDYVLHLTGWSWTVTKPLLVAWKTGRSSFSFWSNIENVDKIVEAGNDTGVSLTEK